MKTPDPTSLFLIMYRIRTHLLAILITFGGLLPLLALDRPNILWLSAEDHGPQLGCYGDTYADTPNLDAFAKSSLLYKSAISTAPVCAPARTTIICGMYAPSLGAHHMRSEAAKPEWLKFYPQYLREAGYYCTNNSKTDYNIKHNIRDIWNESSGKAHYNKRKKGQPFFAIFNQTCTHESRIRARKSATKHDPSKAPIPPYHPDVPAVRDNWAQYYDRLSQMDDWFGAHLRALKEEGLAEDTIVIFWADHGSGMPRGKRYAGWSGLHVPMIMHIPEKWKHLRPPEYKSGSISKRLVGFVDLGATMLSLVGIKPPAFQQGKPFAGKHVTEKPAHSFGFRGRMDERPDCSRTVTDGRFVYIRNFMPHLPHGQVLHYQMETQSTRIWRRLYNQGKLNKIQSAFWERKAPEELYDISQDPHETRNLAQDAKFRATLISMRNALYQNLEKTFDVALLPEGLLHDLAKEHGLTPGDLARDKSLYPIQRIRKASDILLDTTVDEERIVNMLRAKLPAQRYWAAHACLYLGEEVIHKHLEALNSLLKDPSRSVQIAAAEALATYPAGAKGGEEALEVLLANADPTKSSAYHAVAALNALDHQPQKVLEPYKQRITKLPTNDPDAPGRPNGYAARMHKHITEPIPDTFSWEKNNR
jgi:uncharacterized sulfatase